MTLVLIEAGAAARSIARVSQGEARREHVLRDLIYDNPTIMPVHEIDLGVGRLFTVARELNVPGVGFIDVLLADERGRLIVVECKLWRNPQARREVIGQILDYARELSRYGYEDLQRQISIATKRQGNVFYQMACEAGGTMDEAVFVDRVARDLSAGRFLLLVAGDGIGEGTRRISEYLREQPGLAFEFGLIEIAEYRYEDAAGQERLIVQPRILAQTAIIERHVIRSEVQGVVIDPVVETSAERTSRAPSEAGQAWSGFVERFVAETRFDDPAQPTPRRGGNGWIRIALPGPFYINAYRDRGRGLVGVQVRFAGGEGSVSYEALLAERAEIDAEFERQHLDAPDWKNGEVPLLGVTTASALPWDEEAEIAQRVWMAKVANQFVNSLRPRLQRLLG